ncbi:MAG: TolC family protein [Gemmataceae bacterium]
MKDPYRRQTLQNLQFNVVYRLFLSLLEEAFRERTERVRRLWPDLPPLCVDGVDLLSDCDDKVLATVTRAALENRLDLMNQRAQVVDSWRQIRVAANALLGTFTVQYHFDTYTPLNGGRPFNFSGSRSTNQLAFNAELPIVRIAQRNAYRATLIAYQQQRRDLIQAEDQVVFQSRQTLRQLRAAANSYHNVQKRAVELAYIQVDQALQAFSQPQQPSGPALPAGAVGPPTSGGGSGDPAALTQQLLQTQNSLLQAQNTLYNTWISYLINRMSLYRDVGLMPIDPRGVWIDDVQSCRCPPATLSADGQPANQQPADQRSDQLPAPRPVDGGERERPDDKLPALRPVENPAGR